MQTGEINVQNQTMTKVMVNAPLKIETVYDILFLIDHEMTQRNVAQFIKSLLDP